VTSAAAAHPAAGALRRPAIPDVVAEHLEEHGFLALQRRRLGFSIELPARRLAEHDERLAAHWDGLVVNLPESAELAADRLGADDPWERASAIRFWLTYARPALDALLERWADTPPEHAPSWREALRGMDADAVEALVPPPRRPGLAGPWLAVLVDALGWHARLPRPLAEAAARHADAAARAATARGLAHAPDPEEAAALLAPLLEDPDPAPRRRALWSLGLVDRRAGLERARELARGARPDAFAVRVMGLLGERDDDARLAEAAGTAAGRPAAFFALADLGTLPALDALRRVLAIEDPAVRAAATVALEGALGAIPRADASAPATPSEADARWRAVTEGLGEDARLIGGLRYPWHGGPGEEPGAWRWRMAVRRRGGAIEWRREVPDGFFEALPADDVRPGE
jgi:HEAT repeat protein